jgi:hypothetical protein
MSNTTQGTTTKELLQDLKDAIFMQIQLWDKCMCIDEILRDGTDSLAVVLEIIQRFPNFRLGFPPDKRSLDETELAKAFETFVSRSQTASIRNAQT